MADSISPVYSELSSSATVLCCTFAGLASAPHSYDAERVMRWLHAAHVEFDALCVEYDVGKVQAFGTDYVAVAGLTMDKADHAGRIVRLARSMAAAATHLRALDGGDCRVCIGVASGELAAGVVGIKVPRFNVFGEAMLLADSLSKACHHGQVLMSQDTWALLDRKEQAAWTRLPAQHDVLGWPMRSVRPDQIAPLPATFVRLDPCDANATFAASSSCSNEGRGAKGDVAEALQRCASSPASHLPTRLSNPDSDSHVIAEAHRAKSHVLFLVSILFSVINCVRWCSGSVPTSVGSLWQPWLCLVAMALMPLVVLFAPDLLLARSFAASTACGRRQAGKEPVGGFA